MSTTLTTHSNAETGTDALVGVHQVGVWFGQEPRITIAEGLDLTVHPGQWHCLAGRSGSGKTSLLRVIGGFVEPQAGGVTWGGEPIGTWSPERRAAHRRPWMGYVDQSSAVIEGFTTVENVLMPAVPDRSARRLSARGVELLELVGLEDRVGLRAELLSGGERQRAALARALLMCPAVLLLDEPTASQDRATADRVIGLLHTLVEEGVAVISASHDPGVIEAAHTLSRLD